MYHLNHNLSDRYGAISNLHGFLYRHMDTGFKSKWSGYWAPPYKFLDYYAVKVNGIWLDHSTVESVEYGDHMIYHHTAGGLKVKERVETPDKLPGFKVTLEIQNPHSERKAAHAAVEPAVDIRSKSEDIAEGEYSVDNSGERLLVSRDNQKLMITGDSFELEGDPQHKTHYPREEQKCFIPGHLSFKREIKAESEQKIELEFSTSDASFGSLRSTKSEFENLELGPHFSSAKKSVENLVYDRKGKGIIAGHPWFQNYWSRDTYWSLLGLIDLGFFELSHEILENFAEKDGFPNQIPLEGDSTFPNADAAPLFVIASAKLERHWQISDKIEEKQEEAFEYLEIDETGVVQHDEKGTWMDTLERGPAIDIQSLWLQAAKIKQHESAEELEEGMKKFVEDGKALDSLAEDSPASINPSIPLMYGQIPEKCLEEINAEFSSRFGARTRSMADPGYDPSGYHSGSVWGLTTAWASAANFANGKEIQGYNFLEKMTQFTDRNHVEGFPEVVNAETGELMGCGEQAWSAALFIHVIDRYLLGIKVEEDKVIIEPSEKAHGKRIRKRIRGEYIDLKFEGGKAEILNSPDLNIELR